MNIESIAIACDHAGYELKGKIIEHLETLGIEKIYDCGTNSSESCDYPDFGHLLAEAYETGNYNIGIGYVALGDAALTGDNNIAIGRLAGSATTSGDDNIAIGQYTGDALTSGGGNTLMGLDAGGAMTVANINVAIGKNCYIYTL